MHTHKSTLTPCLLTHLPLVHNTYNTRKNKHRDKLADKTVRNRTKLKLNRLGKPANQTHSYVQSTSGGLKISKIVFSSRTDRKEMPLTPTHPPDSANAKSTMHHPLPSESNLSSHPSTKGLRSRVVLGAVDWTPLIVLRHSPHNGLRYCGLSGLERDTAPGVGWKVHAQVR